MNDNRRIQGIGMTSQRTRERLIQRLKEKGVKDPKVLEALRAIPRHIFLDEALEHRAYEDTALPIGFQQTLSQPYIVARMTEALLAGGPLGRVLEVGTGSGYQTAVLASLVKSVYTVERIRELQQRARTRMQMLKLYNIHYRASDGGMGWPQYAPYDGIMVTAAPEFVPNELLEQLAVGGRMVIPVGSAFQELRLIEHTEEGFEETVLETVRFVPLIRGS